MQPNTIYYELTASEFEWQISENKTIKAWGFNKQIPGPVLKAKKGDSLVVRVTNELNQPTTIHWHGIQLPSSMDGTGEVQKPIAPGEQFEYHFQVPDAGTFWYHSHHNETEQMERGMYGSIVIEDGNDPKVDQERIFMIDDMKLKKNNTFKTGNVFSRWIERHDGREGDTLLINGKEMPDINVHAGQIERWRFINASSARYFVLHLSGKPFQVIGTDGGLLETAREVTEILMTPGERTDIIVGPFQIGESFFIETLPYNRMTFVKSKHEQYAKVLVGEPKPSVASIPNLMRKIEPLALPNAPVNRKIKFSVGPSVRNGIDFLVNNTMHANDKPVNMGELQIWELSNTSLMDHPFHLHGFFFQVLQVNGEDSTEFSWKDTVNLPPRCKVKIAWMPDSRPGLWMYHCHILEHHEAGMMANFEVINRNHRPRHSSKHHHHH